MMRVVSPSAKLMRSYKPLYFDCSPLRAYCSIGTRKMKGDPGYQWLDRGNEVQHEQRWMRYSEKDGKP